MGRIVAISDMGEVVPLGALVGGLARPEPGQAPAPATAPDAGAPRVTGGPLERMPLAAVAHGLADRAELWSFAGPNRLGAEGVAAGAALGGRSGRPGLARRWFRVEPGPGPRRSSEMVEHLAATGAPSILCVWGDGVDHAILDAARGAVTLYASLAPEPLRIADDLAARFDIVLAGCDAHAMELRARLPGVLCPVMPLGPEFASDEDFRPLGGVPEFDAVLLASGEAARPAAAIAALAARPDLSVLALAEGPAAARALRRAAEGRLPGLAVEDRPEAPEALNRQLNRARAALVLEAPEGAPALLTQAMLAGRPVVAAADLPCGLQYVLPGTGRVAALADLAPALGALLAEASTMDPRAQARARWTWPHTIRRLAALVGEARARRGNAAA